MAGAREVSSCDESGGGNCEFCLIGDGGSLGGEQLGVISRRAGEIWGKSRVVVKSSKSIGVSSSSVYIGVGSLLFFVGFVTKSVGPSDRGPSSNVARAIRFGASFMNCFFSSSENNDFLSGLGTQFP